jgi:hypothetical protein
MRLRIWFPLVVLGLVSACSDVPTAPETADLPGLETSSPAIALPSAPMVAHFSVGSGGDGTGPTVTTDKLDYQPGDTVTISGSGWWAGETVELLLEEDPATHDPHVFASVADSAGDFENRDFVVQEEHLGVTFTLTATGLTSGLTAGGVFTDGNFNIISSPASLFTAVTYDRFNGSGTCTGSPNSINQSLNYGTNLGLNDGQSIRFTPPAVDGYTFTGYNAGDLTVSSLGGGVLCVSGFQTPAGNPTRVLTLNYAASNTPPTADAGGPYTGNEGSAIQLDGSGSSDSDGTIASYAWSLGTFTNPDGGTCAFVGGVSTGVSPSVTCDDDGTLTVSLIVTDDDGASSAADQATVTVGNVDPVVTIIAPTSYSVWPITGIAGVSSFIDASFTDAGTNDTHTCSVDWGNSTSTAGTVTETQGTGTGTCTLTPLASPYGEAGIYTITVTVTDDDSGAGTATVDIVVYDPEAGFVTGGGWIYSEAGAYKWDELPRGQGHVRLRLEVQEGREQARREHGVPVPRRRHELPQQRLRVAGREPGGHERPVQGNGHGQRRGALQVHAVGGGRLDRPVPDPHLGGERGRARRLRQRLQPGYRPGEHRHSHRREEEVGRRGRRTFRHRVD